MILTDLIKRVEREYLHPGDEQPTRTLLTAEVDASTITIPYDGSMLAPDESNALRPGSIIEVGLEQMLVRNFGTESLTVARGRNGTTAATHTIDSDLTISPKYPASFTYRAIIDAILSLHPKLWRVETHNVVSSRQWIGVPAETTHAVGFHTDYSTHACILQRRPQFPSGKAVRILGPVMAGTSGILETRERFTTPESEYADTADVGVRDEWLYLVTLKAAAFLLSGSPTFEAFTQEFITEQAKAQTLQPGSTGAIIRLMMAMYERELDTAHRSLVAEGAQRVSRVRVGRYGL